MLYKKIPKNFHPQIEVVGCFMEHGGRFLLLYRHEARPNGKCWGQPAGKMEKGEDRLQAMIREIKEETGQKLSPNQLAHAATVYVKYPEYHFVYHVFHSSLKKKLPVVLSDEHTEFKWVTPEESLKLTLIPDFDRCIKNFYKIYE